MDFNLVLGDDMKIKGQGEMVIRQGTHLMDNIVIALGGKYQGSTAYIEFDLPKNRKHVSKTMNITGDIRYGVPEDVTAYSGFGYMQISILTGEILEKSALYAFEITSSICSSKAYSPKDKHDFFFNVDETMKASRAQTEESKKTTENAKKSIGDMNALKTDIEQKLAAGAFKGEDGKDGKDGKDAVIELAQDRGTATDVAASQAFVTRELSSYFKYNKSFKGNYWVEALPLNGKPMIGLVCAYEDGTDRYNFSFISRAQCRPGAKTNIIVKQIFSNYLLLSFQSDGTMFISQVIDGKNCHIKLIYTEFD